MKQEREKTLQNFGKEVAKIREKKGISLRELQIKTSISYSALSRIEHGKVNITLLSLLDLADGLGVSPKKLLDFPGTDHVVKK